jgi:hypothetical protein
MRSKRSYVAFETLISVAINTILSVGFVYLVFHRQTLIPATGVHGIVVDMVPQTFIVILMSFLVPSILTRRRRVTGALSWHDAGSASAPYNIFLWAGLAALLGTSLVRALTKLAHPAGSASGWRQFRFALTCQSCIRSFARCRRHSVGHHERPPENKTSTIFAGRNVCRLTVFILKARAQVPNRTVAPALTARIPEVKAAHPNSAQKHPELFASCVNGQHS